MTSEKFSRLVVETVAKRAASICSNINCSAITSGPAEDENRTINVGEAAHIYGARPGSARFQSTLSEVERSDITNAIWLCCTCHKKIDSDAKQFPAELLFEWKRSHEFAVKENLGKSSVLVYQKFLKGRLAEFENSSYLAQQIIIDKPYAWEYRLTAEFLRSMLEPIKHRWEALEKGLYTLPHQPINSDNYLLWYRSQLDALQKQLAAISGIFNGEIQASWGAPGEEGSESHIFRVCTLISEICQCMLQWEETVRFVTISSEFDEIQQLLVGIAGEQLKKIIEIPSWFSSIFTEDRPKGNFEYNMVFTLSPQWQKASDRAIKKLKKKRWLF